LRAARLAQAAHGRGHLAGDAARARPEEAHSAAPWRADQERAGRAPVRTAGVHGATRRPLKRAARQRARPLAFAGDQTYPLRAAGATAWARRSASASRTRLIQ